MIFLLILRLPDLLLNHRRHMKKSETEHRIGAIFRLPFKQLSNLSYISDCINLTVVRLECQGDPT